MQPDFSTLKPVVGAQPDFKTLKPVVAKPIEQGPTSTFKATVGGANTIIPNTLKTFGNVPSSAKNLLYNTVVVPAENIGKSREAVTDIYKNRGFVEGTKDIAGGFNDTLTAIGKAPGEFIVNKGDEQRLEKINAQSTQIRDNLTNLIAQKRLKGEDTTRLVKALKDITESIGDTEAKIGGSQEQRRLNVIDKSIDVAKYPIENPSDVLAALYGGPKVAGAKTTDGISTTASLVTRNADTSVAGMTNRITKNLPSKYVADTSEAWNKIGTDYVRSNKVLTKGTQRGKDSPQFLAERGITPESTLKPGERTKIADKIAFEDTEPFEAVLDDSLREVDSYSPRISLADEEAQLLNSIKKQGFEVGKENTIKNGIKKKFELLREKYGDDMSRVELNAEKKKFWRETNFDTSGQFGHDVNYQMGKKFKEAIEAGTEDVNVKGLNSILGDHYEAAKFLRSVDGKAGKLTTGQKIKRAAVKSVSTAVGSAVGGGVPGAITGFVLADSINAGLNAMPNPLKMYYLNRLQKANPALYQEYVKSLNFLKQQEVLRDSRLKLPAPSPLGSEKNPIITPAPTTYEKPAKIINRTEQPTKSTPGTPVQKVKRAAEKTYYHGTSRYNTDAIKKAGKFTNMTSGIDYDAPVYFSNDAKIAAGYTTGASGKGEVLKFTGNPKIATADEVKSITGKDSYKAFAIPHLPSGKAVMKQLKEAGFDGAEFMADGLETVVWNKDKLKLVPKPKKAN